MAKFMKIFNGKEVNHKNKKIAKDFSFTLSLTVDELSVYENSNNVV